MAARFDTSGLIELSQLARKPGDHGNAAQNATSALLQVKLKAIFGFPLMANAGQTLARGFSGACQSGGKQQEGHRQTPGLSLRPDTRSQYSQAGGEFLKLRKAN
jgi:hypothetical protein